ncbi:hypothetical protein LAZ40_02125 [Cereibacter sphaeroides]|uniref:hypothetical protein n=1 Tax=Cereibacter sphaeroides TaxID=1063 RepID=UPI001F183244|nr:hypothetical protein [Cereibacter sphaeroides]MCE6957854.1 hypothetical protein [Cereibacter sphaeroides]MCE6971823.1 hypothetical protein [Cereibacter sphaeroides]
MLVFAWSALLLTGLLALAGTLCLAWSVPSGWLRRLGRDPGASLLEWSGLIGLGLFLLALGQAS